MLKRLRRPGLRVRDLPPIDVILVTHAHFDHLHRPSLRAIVQYNRLSVDARETSLGPQRNTNYDILLTYLTSPGTALYVGANSNFAPANTGWQLFTKMSYLLRR